MLWASERICCMLLSAESEVYFNITSSRKEILDLVQGHSQPLEKFIKLMIYNHVFVRSDASFQFILCWFFTWLRPQLWRKVSRAFLLSLVFSGCSPPSPSSYASWLVGNQRLPCESMDTFVHVLVYKENFFVRLQLSLNWKIKY